MTRIAGFLPVTLAAFALQDGRVSPPEVDPYTRGKPEALELAGYRSFGPFVLGDGHSTPAVEEALGGVPLLWVETAHFRLGSSLDEVALHREGEERGKVRKELLRLKERIPRVKPRVGRLDPWLRLHLFALRLEELYAEFRARLGLEGSEQGPGLLDSDTKFSVLLFQRESSLARYAKAFCGRDQSQILLHWFPEQRIHLYAISADALEGTDTDLHFAVVFGVTQNLVCSLGGFDHLPPRWWVRGVGHWFARRVSSDILLFTAPPGEALPSDRLADWEALVLGRVRAGWVPSWDSTLSWDDGQPHEFADFVVLWSRVDFLLDQGPDVLRPLLHRFHDPLGAVPDREAILEERFRTALSEALERDLPAIDTAWKAWVEETYDPRSVRRRRGKRK